MPRGRPRSQEETQIAAGASSQEKTHISIVARRLKSGAVFRAASDPIPLREPLRWALYIGNADISVERIHELVAKKGWEYVGREDLAIEPEAVGFRELNGRIVRGERGHEVLLKMERSDFTAIQAAKDRLNRELTFGQKARQSILERAAAPAEAGGLGDGGRGADFLQHQGLNLGIRDSRERVALDELEPKG